VLERPSSGSRSGPAPGCTHGARHHSQLLLPRHPAEAEGAPASAFGLGLHRAAADAGVPLGVTAGCT